MFTGLVAGLGVVEKIQKFSSQSRFGVHPLFKWDELVDGESIAVNGVCLTVENHGNDRFFVYASAETMGRTNLASLKEGDKVNLERALEFGQRVGGHLVSGHVDCVAFIDKLDRSGESIFCRLSFPAKYAPEVLEKGSIALNGISLTINKCGRDYLEVNLIPDTARRTNAASWRPGEGINMETDLLGKYVINYMRYDPAAKGQKEGLNMDFLARNGFI